MSGVDVWGAVVVILIKKGIISEYNLIMPEVLSSKV